MHSRGCAGFRDAAMAIGWKPNSSATTRSASTLHIGMSSPTTFRQSTAAQTFGEAGCRLSTPGVVQSQVSLKESR